MTGSCSPISSSDSPPSRKGRILSKDGLALSGIHPAIMSTWSVTPPKGTAARRPRIEPADLPEKIHRALHSGQAGDAAARTRQALADAGSAGSGAGPLAASAASGGQDFVWPKLEDLARLGMTLKDFLGCMEHNLLLEALDRYEGSHQQAADCLGIKRTTLIEKLKRKGLLKA